MLKPFYLNIFANQIRYLVVITFILLSTSVHAQVMNTSQRDKPVATTISAPEIDAKAWASEYYQTNDELCHFFKIRIRRH